MRALSQTPRAPARHGDLPRLFAGFASEVRAFSAPRRAFSRAAAR